MLTRNHRTLSAFSLILFFCLILPSTLFGAQEARLTNLIVTNTRDNLLLYLNVQGAFQDKMKEAILSGVPTTFSFLISLNSTRNFWLDKKIADIRLAHTIKYDNLKKEFSVNRSWDNQNPYITQSFEKAQKRMTEIDSLPVIALKDLERGRQYQIRAKAELNKLTLPFYLHYVLFVVSLWDFETDWYTIDFIY